MEGSGGTTEGVIGGNWMETIKPKLAVRQKRARKFSLVKQSVNDLSRMFFRTSFFLILNDHVCRCCFLEYQFDDSSS